MHGQPDFLYTCVRSHERTRRHARSMCAHVRVPVCACVRKNICDVCVCAPVLVRPCVRARARRHRLLNSSKQLFCCFCTVSSAFLLL